MRWHKEISFYFVLGYWPNNLQLSPYLSYIKENSNQQKASFFVPASMISYQARVEVNTGLPPGKKEDRFAKCHYNRMVVCLSAQCLVTSFESIWTKNNVQEFFFVAKAVCVFLKQYLSASVYISSCILETLWVGFYMFDCVCIDQFALQRSIASTHR